MMVVEEFIQLNEDQATSQRKKCLKIEHNLQQIPEQLALLSQDFTTICVATVQTDAVIQIQDEGGASYDVYILLSFSDYFQDIPTTKASMKKISKYNNTLPTYKSQNTIQAKAQEKSRKVPEKYMKPVKKTTQIPRTSVIKLIERLDTNNDGFVTADDIVRFTKQNFLFYSEEVSRHPA